MIKFLYAVIENTQRLSQKLLLTSFMSGYVLAIILYTFYRPQVHDFIGSIFNGL